MLHLRDAYWVNLSKGGGKDWVFQGLAGLLRWISQGRSPRESRGAALPARGKPCPSQPFYFTCLALLNPYWPSWIRIGPPESVLALLKCIEGEF